MTARIGIAGECVEWAADARFALYYAPARGSRWWQAGSAWLGRDAETGAICPAPQPAGLNRPLPELTRAPRRYGWHGTLVAPFTLADGVSPRALLAAARQWAQSQRAFELGVEAATLGDFVALRPATTDDDARMRALASSGLQALKDWRAPQTEAELARRLEAPLSARQHELLLEWGYPYVFEEFRFHMTLSNSLTAAAERAALLDWWSPQVNALGPLAVDHAALFVEPAPGSPFVLWQRLPFGAEAGEV